MCRIWKNAEGYYDPTAGEALSSMGGTKMESVKDGEIWEVETKYGSRIEMLVLRQNDRYISGLMLTENEAEVNCVSVPAMTIKYADAGRTMYAYEDTLVRYIKTISDTEMDRIREEVRKALGLEKKPEIQIEDAIEAVTKRQKEEKKEEPDMESRLEIEKYKTRADVFEQLYKELLLKVV